MPYLAQVRYLFAFRLGMPDLAFWVKTKTDEKGAFIRVWSGKADRQLVLREQKDRKPEHRREWLRSVIQPQGIISRLVCINNDDDLFLEEVVDTVGFTRMDVTFECQGGIPKNDSHEQDKIRQNAISLAQRFVRTYRLIANQVEVRIPNEADSPIIEVRAGTDYSFNTEEIDAKLAMISRRFQWPLPKLSGAVKEALSNDKIALLGNLLRQGDEPAMFQQLLLEAKELSIVHGDHRISVIISQSAFEVYVQSRLTEECKIRGVLHLTSSRGDQRDVEVAIIDGDLRKELLGQYARVLSGRSVKDCPEHNSWFKNAYNPRNEIVHRGRRDVTEADAQASFESVMTYCEYLDRALIAGRENGQNL